MPRDFRIRALGEIAIRCADIGRMAEFYEQVIGLERLSGDYRSGIVFYRIADGHAGHTAVLALFAHDAPQRDVHPTASGPPRGGAGSTLHHLALSLGHDEQARAMAWYDEIGQPYRVEHFSWIGWRGVFTEDPEGNTVELVAYDDSERDGA